MSHLRVKGKPFLTLSSHLCHATCHVGYGMSQLTGKEKKETRRKGTHECLSHPCKEQHTPLCTPVFGLLLKPAEFSPHTNITLFSLSGLVQNCHKPSSRRIVMTAGTRKQFEEERANTRRGVLKGSGELEWSLWPWALPFLPSPGFSCKKNRRSGEMARAKTTVILGTERHR